MTINFMYSYDTDRHYFYPSTIKFNHETFDKSLDNIRKFFTEDINIDLVDIHVYIQNEFNDDENDIDSIRLIMQDVKDEKSCTFRMLESLFNESDIVAKKVSMLRYLLENYFVSNALYNEKMNDGKHVECVYEYWGPQNFKYTLPIDVISKHCKHFSRYGANMLDLHCLSPEELAVYVIPRYYLEMRFLKDDKIKIAKLSASWAD